MSELIPFFDECLAVSREELETVIASVSQDSPEYAKLQNLQIAFSSRLVVIVREFKQQVRAVVGNSD